MYILEGLRRAKDNPGLKEICFRHISAGTDNVTLTKDIEILRKRIELTNEPGLWRIYRTVNKRDVAKAKRAFVHQLIDLDDSKFLEKDEQGNDFVSTLWKTVLCQPENKAERNFLIDVDSKDLAILNEVLESIPKENIIDQKETLNGFHIVTKPFDTRELTKKFEAPLVEVKKDALLFVASFRVE